MRVLSVEGLPHPGKDAVLKYVSTGLRGTAPLVHHQCICDRYTSASYPVFLSALRNAQQLRRLASESQILLGRPFVDASHIPVISRLHSDVFVEMLRRNAVSIDEVRIVLLECDPHDCFERLMTSPLSSMVALDDVFESQVQIEEVIESLRARVLRIPCPPFFDDDETAVLQIADKALHFLRGA